MIATNRDLPRSLVKKERTRNWR